MRQGGRVSVGTAHQTVLYRMSQKQKKNDNKQFFLYDKLHINQKEKN